MKTPGASLKLKIMAGVGSLVLAFGVTVMGSIHRGLSQMLKEELTRRGVTIARVLVVPAEDAILTDDRFALHSLFRETMRGYDDVRYIYVRGPAGDISAHTFPAGIPRGLASVNPAASAPPGAYRMRPVMTDEGHIQDIAYPLLSGRLGSVHVGMNEQRVRRRIARMVIGWGAGAALMLASGLLVAYWLTSTLAARFARLIEVARKVGEGNLDVRADDGLDDEVGRLAGALNRMIEDLKRSQSDLIRSGKLAAIGELASCVSHEINNPLNTMAICTQALLDRAKSPELLACEEFGAFPEYLKTVNDEIFRCKAITGGLLDLARHKEPRRSAVDLNELIARTLPLVAHRARQAGQTMTFDPAAGSLTIRADADQIRQVILNILINAVDHGAPGGEVRIRTERGAGGAAVSVADSGGGIAPENLRRVFEPFFTTKPVGKGTGLGLAICQKIVDNHRGRIEVASRVGAGSTFTFSIPYDGQEAPLDA
ncbi:MAG: HAMP domain-containing protein [Elusimicrobia bacterium]|nr:HAMP domain-containing protein [Elusimicrobiota bacterium]